MLKNPFARDDAWFADLRAREFSRLDKSGEAYLDYTGSALYAESHVHAHLEFLAGTVLGNPHSQSVASLRSTEIIEDARRMTLEFLSADRAEYEVVFTANATGGLRLVGEAFPFAITRGPDGNVWFTERFGQRIGKVTPAGDITYYPTTLHTLDSIVRGSGNTLWFTSFGDDRIARITTDGAITPLPVIPNSGPTGIFANRTAVWFLAYESNRVYRITAP